MQKRVFLLLLLLLNAILVSNAQSTSATSNFQKSIGIQDSLPRLPNRYFNKVSVKANLLNRRLAKRTQKALRRLQKQEERINSRLSKIDSLAAHNLFTNAVDSFSHLQKIIKSPLLSSPLSGHKGAYIPYLDTLRNSLNFLNKYGGKLDQVKGAQRKLRSSLASVKQLEGKLNQVQNVQQYIQERKQLLQNALNKYNGVFRKNLGKIAKEAYYFKAQVQNYKELWQHPDKIEARAIALLNKMPAFNGFMKTHSALASLFNMAGSQTGSSVQENLQGLQTRAMVQREIQARLQGVGAGLPGGASSQAGGRQQIQQQMALAKQKLQELKNKLPGGGTTADLSASRRQRLWPPETEASAQTGMPDFRPKELRSKTFFQRLEFGANVQFGKATSYLPTTSDFAGQIAYKFSKNGSVGIGASFKLGWNDPLPTRNIVSPINSTFSQNNFPIAPRNFLKKIHFTAQGAGLRSFLDYKLRGTFYVNGGFELNYNKMILDVYQAGNSSSSFRDGREGAGWTKSVLLGIEKKYKISDKLKGNMMLLFDFLYKQHVPQTQPVVFRVGYNF